MTLQWEYDDFKKWKTNGCSPNQSVVSLDLSFNKLTSIPLELIFLTQLTELNLSNNELTEIPTEIWCSTQLQKLYIHNNHIRIIPPEIGFFNHLQKFYIYNNQITIIPPEIGRLTRLQIIDFADNHITTIPPEIGLLTHLQIIDFSCNGIKIIPSEIGFLTQLEYINFSQNQLTTIPSEIGLLTHLVQIELENNHITTIPPEIGFLAHLEIICISRNYITTIPPQLQACRNLIELNYNNNPIEYVPPCILRMVQRQHTAHGIYDDNQSVHNSSIQQSIKDSILRLIGINPTLDFETITKSIVEDATLTDFSKQSLIEYCKDESTHSALDITFRELLVAVWNRIVINENSTEIKHVLNQEMTDAECKCFTGRISRLVNCLNGFDELVNIKIDDNEQIGNVILVVKQQLGDDYDITKHKEIATTRLKELGYSDEIITVWIDAI